MPKARKRLVSKEKAERVRQERVEHFTNLEGTTTETLDSFPSEFVGVKTNGKAVRKLANQLYPELTGPCPPHSYTVIPEDGRYLVKLSRKARRKLPKDHPPYIIIRAVHVVSDDVQDRFVALWLRMNALGVKFPVHKRDNRSSTPALHTGVWHLSSAQPMVSVDTRQDNPLIRELLEEFLTLVRIHIAPTIRRLIALYCPKLLEKQDRARQYMQSTQVRDPMHQLGIVDFEGAFFTVAIKEGSSEVPHLDFNDHPHSMTWVVPIGRFSGGHFVSPQLQRTIPVTAGQVMGAMTRFLLHSGTAVTDGSRLVLTCFTDHTLISHSERHHSR